MKSWHEADGCLCIRDVFMGDKRTGIQSRSISDIPKAIRALCRRTTIRISSHTLSPLHGISELVQRNSQPWLLTTFKLERRHRQLPLPSFAFPTSMEAPAVALAKSAL